MDRRTFLFQSALALGLTLVVLTACSRPPLDSSATAPAADAGPLSGGQIGVTLCTGSLPNGAGFVDLIQPDGSKLSQNAAPACTFTALTQSGSYRIQYRDQAAAQPAYTTVNLSPSVPIANVQLQLGGASLQVQPAPFQASSYAFVACSFQYNVQVNQAPADQQDLLLDIDPATLPPGWTYSFGKAVARGPLSTTLLVSAAEATTVTATLKVRARGGALEMDQVLNLQRAWSLSMTAVPGNSGYGYAEYTRTYICWQQYTATVHAEGVPAGSNVYLNCLNCIPGPYGGGLDGVQAGGLLVPTNTPVMIQMEYLGTQTLPRQLSISLDAYCSPPQSL